MLEVIGAGFGRTGTHSLGLALEKLGFGPCYSLPEVAKNPGHTEIWKNAIDGKDMDWENLFKSYKSSVEWPAASFIGDLVQNFPEARFVLTQREPESWYESACKTIFEGLELSAHNPDPIKRERSGMSRRLILEHTIEGKYWNKEHTIAIYVEHIQHVVEIVPQKRLLHFDVKDGWEPLCEFLQKPIPQETFPWLNERKEFMASEPDWARKIKEDKRR
ncbi:MAG: sulfotransferase family protein [Anaerolineales bacterium]|nr:sulfotransferase family protein [Anaerolineae bacterium]PWB75138.1 MAG: sulfotransferase family protein [Anaerolineales bacterium]